METRKRRKLHCSIHKQAACPAIASQHLRSARHTTVPMLQMYNWHLRGARLLQALVTPQRALSSQRVLGSLQRHCSVFQNQLVRQSMQRAW